MKNIICIVLCISLFTSIICVPVSAITENTKNSNISGFISGISELAQKYDANKDFEVTSEYIISESISDDAPLYYSASSVSENETDDVSELNFQTCRLIVQSDVNFNNYGAVEKVSGFENFYILQYRTETDTQKAYESFSNDPSILSVDIDAVISIDSLETTSTTTETTYTKEDFYNCWSLNATGMDKVLEYYSDKQFSKIIVGVIDTGVNLDHELFKGRLVRTYFNSTGEDDPKDETDKNGHGTAVTSCIIKTTPYNVKIANYRIGTAKGQGTVTNVCAGILQAVTDNVKIISLSVHLNGVYELQKSTLEHAKTANCFITSSAGNTSSNIDFGAVHYFNSSDYTCTVGASNRYNYPTNFTSYGKNVDIMAPGENVILASIDGSYGEGYGTSFSSPFVAGVYAMLTSIKPTLTTNEKMHMIKGSFFKLSEPYTKYVFETGLIDCISLFNIPTLNVVEFSLKSGTYIDSVSIELSAEPGCDIYYTMDETYPSPSNGILYKNPITFNGDYFGITAVAYKEGKRSSYSKETIHACQTGSNDMFTISDDGIITNYSGNVVSLKIPEKINNVSVIGIAENVFNTPGLLEIYLPDTLSSLGDTSLWGGTNQNGCFYENTIIKYIHGKNIKIVGSNAFHGCSSLRQVDFPNCEIIGTNAFYSTNLIGGIFPKVHTILTGAFNFAQYLRELYLPNCTKMLDEAFKNCRQLQHLYAPLIDIDTESIEFPDWEFDLAEEGLLSTFENTYQLSQINLEKSRLIGWNNYGIGGGAFYLSNIRRIDLSNVEYIYEIPLPQATYLSQIYQPVTVELNLPATLRRCVDAEPYLDEDVRNYVVHASPGTYAEEWAEENGITFISLNKETSIAEDIEPVWDKYSYKPLYFDARGFNRTYQWYGSYDNKIGNDVAINGATTNEFDPGENCKYAYYYCQMTSTDIDNDGNIVSSFTVNSTLCQNRFYYMSAKDKTEIDYDNHLIFSTLCAQSDMSQMVNIPESMNYYTVPSTVYKNYYWYGTGSSLLIYHNGGTCEKFTLIVQGDVNGDSAVDVLDCFAVSLDSNNQKNLEGHYKTAADIDRNDEIDVVDYQQVVNLALS